MDNFNAAIQGLEVAKQMMIAGDQTGDRNATEIAKQILMALNTGDQSATIEKTKMANGFTRQKHTLTGALAPREEHRPYSELAFFQDCALDAPMINTIVQPQASILNMIPAFPTNLENRKQGYLLRNTVDTKPGQTAPVTVCDDCEELDDNITACKIDTMLSRLCRSTKVLDTNTLIRKACDRLYDDFFFLGDLTGIRMDFPWITSIEGRNFFVESAVRKQLWNIGRFFQHRLMREIWTGTGTRAPISNQSCLGLINQIRCDYHTNGPAAQGMNIECADMHTPGTTYTPDGTQGWLRRLNSDCKDFGGTCVQSVNTTAPQANSQSTQGANLFEVMQAMEHFLYNRALGMGALPVSWAWFMRSELWAEYTKYAPCQAAFNGCGNMSLGPAAAGEATIDPRITIDATAQIAMRNRMMDSGTVDLNGRTYPVFTDDALPYTNVQVTINGQQRQGRQSSIFLVPFFAFGRSVLFMEHMDYSLIDAALSPIPGSQTDLLGWTDGGRFHHVIRQKNWCFQVQSKTEKRLHFLTPHLAGRIDRVVACPLQLTDDAFSTFDAATGNMTQGALVGA